MATTTQCYNWWGTITFQGVVVEGVTSYGQRPSADWTEADAALTAAITSCRLRTRVQLVDEGAWHHAGNTYISLEPMAELVTALGHRDASAGWCITSGNESTNAETLAALIDAAERELAGGSITGALLAVARHLPALR